MNTKTCSKCRIDKPLNDYHNDKSRKDGKRARCKECNRYDARRWHEVNRQRSRQQALAYKRANIDKVRQRDLASQQKRKQRNAELARKRRQKNPQKEKAAQHSRRARKAHAVPQRWKRSPLPDHLCYWCGTTLTPETTHIDHIMPISLGGQDTPDNTANTCAKCNQSKSATHPLVWLARITTPEPMC